MSGKVPQAPPARSRESVSHRVIEKIADAEDVEAVDLDPVAASVDLDALETLVASADDDLCIQGTIHGHRVEVDGTGAVSVG